VLEQALEALRTDPALAHDPLHGGAATASGFVAWREIPAAPRPLSYTSPYLAGWDARAFIRL
jgi:hypothetical protein